MRLNALIGIRYVSRSTQIIAVSSRYALFLEIQNTKSYRDRFDGCYTYHLDKNSLQGFVDETKCLKFQQAPSAIGTSVYTAAVAAAKMLEYHFGSSGTSTLRKTTILELGAGTGLVGTVAAALGANAALTDLEGSVLKNLESNVEQNSSFLQASLQALHYAWGSDARELKSRLQRFSLWPIEGILAVEVIYYSSCVDPLIRSLLDLTGGIHDVYDDMPDNVEENTTTRCITELCKNFDCLESDLRHHWPKRSSTVSGDSPSILLGFDIRGREGVRSFLTKIQRWFDVKIIPPSQHHPEFICDHVRFLILTRRHSTNKVS